MAIVIRIENPFLLFSLTFPVVVLVVSRYGLLYGMFFNVIIAEVAAYSVEEHIGAFFVQSQMNNVINYDLFIVAHIVIVITVGVLFEERKRREENLQKIIDEEVEKNRRHQLLMLQQNRLAQMGEMIGMIAHQWRQPLNTLSLKVQLLEHKYKNGQADDAYFTQFKQASMDLIRHMSETIDDFRHFFKPQKEKQLFDLNEIMMHAVSLIDPVFESEGIKMYYTLKEPISVLGYGNELGQALINILNNSKDALLERNIEERRINIVIEKQEDKVRLRIEDNAGGISEEIMEKIFDPYFSTKEKRHGTGIGLYMSKIIIEDHCGGNLFAFNSDEGAVFEVVLPITENR